MGRAPTGTATATSSKANGRMIRSKSEDMYSAQVINSRESSNRGKWHSGRSNIEMGKSTRASSIRDRETESAPIPTRSASLSTKAIGKETSTWGQAKAEHQTN